MVACQEGKERGREGAWKGRGRSEWAGANKRRGRGWLAIGRGKRKPPDAFACFLSRIAVKEGGNAADTADTACKGRLEKRGAVQPGPFEKQTHYSLLSPWASSQSQVAKPGSRPIEGAGMYFVVEPALSFWARQRPVNHCPHAAILLSQLQYPSIPLATYDDTRYPLPNGASRKTALSLRRLSLRAVAVQPPQGA